MFSPGQPGRTLAGTALALAVPWPTSESRPCPPRKSRGASPLPWNAIGARSTSRGFPTAGGWPPTAWPVGPSPACSGVGLAVATPDRTDALEVGRDVFLREPSTGDAADRRTQPNQPGVPSGLGDATHRFESLRHLDHSLPASERQVFSCLPARRRRHCRRLYAEPDRPRNVSQRVSRLLRRAAVCRPWLHGRGDGPGVAACVYSNEAAPRRGERPARERRLARPRQAVRLPARGFLAALPEGRRPLARPPAVGNPQRRLAAPSPAAARAFSMSRAPMTTRVFVAR